MCIWFKQSFISLTRVGWGCVRFFTVKINFQPLYIFLEIARSFLKNIKYLSTQIHHLHFVNLYLQIHVIYILHKQKFKHFYTQFWHFITIIVFVRRALFIFTAE